MAIVKLDKKSIKKILGNLPDDALNEKLSLFGVGVEKMSKDEVEVEVTPNRPDMLSFQGLYRALNFWSGKRSNLKYKIKKSEKNYKVTIDSSLKNIRPYTACAIVKGIKYDDEKIKEIIDLQEKLHSTLGRNRKKLAIGIYPLEKITLPIKFTAMKPEEIKFIPLEMDKELHAQVAEALQNTYIKALDLYKEKIGKDRVKEIAVLGRQKVIQEKEKK